MRLLILLPFVPRLDAVHGGGKVMAQLLSHMMGRHEVALVYFRDAGEQGADEAFREGCEIVAEVIRPASGDRSRPARALRRVGTLTGRRPAWVADWRSRAFAQRARDVADAFGPEVIQLEGHVMGQYLPALEGVGARHILVQHEPAARAAPYLRDLPRWSKGPVSALERRSWARYEGLIYRRVDAVVVFTEADRRTVEPAAGGTPIRVIRPGVPLPGKPSHPSGRYPPTLVFVGSFIHPPNVDAARRLVKTIFPRVRRQVAHCRLLIVGDSPPDDLTDRKDGAVLVTGRVPDVSPYLDEAALFVAPLHLGGGIRIKVLEALAAGKAVVATPLALEGLDPGHENVLAVAEDDEEFAEAVVHLLLDEQARALLARRARSWALENLGWEDSISRYEALYAELTPPAGAAEGGRPK